MITTTKVTRWSWQHQSRKATTRTNHTHRYLQAQGDTHKIRINPALRSSQAEEQCSPTQYQKNNRNRKRATKRALTQKLLRATGRLFADKRKASAMPQTAMGPTSKRAKDIQGRGSLNNFEKERGAELNPRVKVAVLDMQHVGVTNGEIGNDE